MKRLICLVLVIIQVIMNFYLWKSNSIVIITCNLTYLVLYALLSLIKFPTCILGHDWELYHEGERYNNYNCKNCPKGKSKKAKIYL